VTRLQFTKLFEPTQIGKMRLKNRIVMPPMGTNYTTNRGYVTQRFIDYHEARAKGGVGLIILEITAPCSEGKLISHQVTIADDSYIPELRQLTEVIHKYGARVAPQLHHGGRQINEDVSGHQPVGPSPIPGPSGETPRELTVDEIAEIVQQFGAGARRAKEAGFDGVEVHGAHQYLISSFLSSATNMRKDRYGGTLENKARFLIEILQSIRKEVGPDYPVWVRLNVQEYGMVNGITIEESKRLVPLIIEAGAQAISVSAYGIGSYVMRGPSPDLPGSFVPLAEEIKKVSSVPVIVAGRLDAEIAEQVLEEGKADLVAIGRRLIADPEWPNKVAEGRLDEINPCIGCLECLQRLMFAGSDTACAVNATVGRERECRIQPAGKVKKVVIAGGGPAGMEAARVAALRGHQVVLFEKESKLGGQLNVATIPPHKGDILPLINYLVSQIEKAGVETRLGAEATPELVMESSPDAVVIAAGGIPIIPDIPGADRPNVITASQALSGEADIRQNVVVIGGGMVGCETAHFLAEKGKRVTVIEMLRKMAADMFPIVRRRLIDGLREKKVVMLTGATCEAITEGSVMVTPAEGQKQRIQADTIILAVGYKANDDLFKTLEGKVPEIYCIGDSSEPRRIIDAINEGYRVGLSL